MAAKRHKSITEINIGMCTLELNVRILPASPLGTRRVNQLAESRVAIKYEVVLIDRIMGGIDFRCNNDQKSSGLKQQKSILQWCWR